MRSWIRFGKLRLVRVPFSSSSVVLEGVSNGFCFLLVTSSPSVNPLAISSLPHLTGSIIVTPIPGAIETKPGSATVPFWGIETEIVDGVSGKVGF